MPIAIIALVVIAGGGLYLLSREKNAQAPAQPARGVTPAPGNSQPVIPIVIQSPVAAPAAAAASRLGLPAPMPAAGQAAAPTKPTKAQFDAAALGGSFFGSLPSLVTGLGGAINEASKIDAAKQLELAKLRPSDLNTSRQAALVTTLKSSPASELLPDVFRSSDGAVQQYHPGDNFAVDQQLAATRYAQDQALIAIGAPPVYSTPVEQPTYQWSAVSRNDQGVFVDANGNTWEDWRNLGGM